MDKVLKVFMCIEETPDISQRMLAKTTGYSLGSVNGILQKLIDDGEIESKALTPNHYVYEITPRGLSHKAALLYDFTLEGYDAIAKIKNFTKTSISDAVASGVKRFYMYGEEDSISRLVKMSLIEMKHKEGIKYSWIDKFDDIDRAEPYRILTWNKETLNLEGPVIHVLMQ